MISSLRFDIDFNLENKILLKMEIVLPPQSQQTVNANKGATLEFCSCAIVSCASKRTPCIRIRAFPFMARYSRSCVESSRRKVKVRRIKNREKNLRQSSRRDDSTAINVSIFHHPFVKSDFLSPLS